MRFASMFAAAAALAIPAAAQAQQERGDAQRSNASIYLGYANVDEGFDDRVYAGAFVNAYSGDIGVHGDVVLVEREESAAFGSVGVSFSIAEGVRPRLTAGTSTDNDSILPELFLSAALEVRPAQGWIVTPSLSYRDFRSGGEELAPSVEVARYFNIAGDSGGYYVAQLRGRVSFNSSDEDGYSISGGLQTVRSNGLSFGATVEFGKITYDSVVGIGVRTDLFAVRPNVGYRFSDRHEIFLRGEYADTDFYTVSGLLVGLKLSF